MYPTAKHRLPAEFERHLCTYLQWPVRADNWREFARFGQRNIVLLANSIVEFEPVRLMHCEPLPDDVRTALLPGVEPVIGQYDDIWVRDTGPTVLVGNGVTPLAIDWRFNSWGGLFSQYDKDDTVARQIAQMEDLESERSPLVLEGGSITTDGRRTLVLTKESVLASNRNPGVTLPEAEFQLRRYLRMENIIWLDSGLAHDEAGGHIDNVCTFASERLLLLAHTDDSEHPSYERLKAAEERLRAATDVDGQAFEIVLVPLPPVSTLSAEEAEGFASTEGTIDRTEGAPVVQSHINLYIANGVVIVPTFGVSTDSTAVEILTRAFPMRRVIPFPGREFVLGGGGVHCLTRDLPANPT